MSCIHFSSFLCCHPHPPMAMAGLGCPLFYTGAPSWNIHYKAVVVSAYAICSRVKVPGLFSSFSHQTPSEEAQLDRELDVLFRMDQQGNVPTVNMYRSLLKRCAKRKTLAQAKRVHAHLAKHGLEFATSLGEFLVSTLVRCGGLGDALQLFYRLPHRTVFSWSAVIDGYTLSGQGKEALIMYQWMLQEGVQPNTYTFVSLLKACSSISDLEEGRRIHFEVLKYGCGTDLFVGTCMLDMYGKCGSIIDALNVFNRLSQRDVVSWNSMISAYVEQEQAEKALQLYERMGQEGVSSNDRTFVSALQACGMLAEKEEAVLVDGWPIKVKSLEKGRAIHAAARRKRFDLDVFVGTTLISMFGKCGSIKDAQAAFDKLSCRDPGAWNSMLAASIENGEAEKTLKLCQDMLDDGTNPNDRTFVSALQACAMLAEKEDGVMVDGLYTKVRSLEKGQAIHMQCHTKGYESDVFVGSALITMYGKCGRVEKALGVFNRLPRRDVVAWTAMLAAYADQGQLEQALQLYRGMQEEGFTPNEVTLVFVLQACSKAGSLGALRLMHQTLVMRAGILSLPVANTLITGYGRCGSMVDALSVFDALSQPDVVSWNALIAAHARQGDSAACMQGYARMKLAGVNPNAVTFLLLLSACSHAGLVDRGLEYFHSMSRDYGISPGIDHYGSIVDLLGRAGHFPMIEDLLIDMQVQPDLQLWVHLLGACQKHGNVALGEHAFRCAVQLQPKVASSYVLMSHIYSDAGMWDSAEDVCRLRREAGAWKEAGQTWVEHEQDVQTFIVGDFRQNV